MLAGVRSGVSFEAPRGNGTDGLIAALKMVVLEDDLHYFPPYEAVPVVNDGAVRRFPGLIPALNELANKISDDDMQRMNYAVDGEHRDVVEVVREFWNRVIGPSGDRVK